MLEIMLGVLLRSGDVCAHGRPTEKEIADADYLLSKAKLAKKYGCLDCEAYSLIEAFNAKRRDVIHNLGEKDIEYAAIRACAEGIGEAAEKLQERYLAIRPGVPSKA